MSLVKIGKAAGMLGVSVQTLHAWEASGELLPDRRSKGATRYYAVDRIRDLTRRPSPQPRQPTLPSEPSPLEAPGLELTTDASGRDGRTGGADWI